MLTQEAPPVMNLGSEKIISINELAVLIAKIAGKQLHLKADLNEYRFEDVCFKPSCPVPMIEESQKLAVAKQIAPAGKRVTAVIDCVLLSRADVLIRPTSNLSICSGFFNPKVPEIIMNRRATQPPYQNVFEDEP